MDTRRWFNQSQPQTLQIAVFLLYLHAAFTLLFRLDDQSLVTLSDLGLLTVDLPLIGFDVIVRLLLAGAGVAAGFGIANEKKWGWYLGVAAAALPLVLLLYVCLRHQVSPLDFDLINLLFDVALFALLVHPMTRDYEKVWFK